MKIETITCEQGTPEWFSARAGIVTASDFHKVLAKSDDMEMRGKYMRQLAGEILTGEPSDGGWDGNRHTERGKLMEPAARELLEITTGMTISQVGFIKNHDIRMGCSPDGLLGDDEGVELKCCIADIQIKRLLKGGLPPEYRAQVEGSLLVTGRRSWKFYSYSTNMPPLIVDVTLTDDRAKYLRRELSLFNAELDMMVATVRRLY